MEKIIYKAGFADYMTSTIEKNAGSDQQIRIVVYLDGRIDLGLMEKTMHAITYIDPVLGCRLIQNGFERHWERQEDIDKQKLLTVIETEDGEKAVNRFISEEVDAFKVPLIRACIVRTPSNDIFCLRVNHALADGGGTKELAYLIADTYKKICENPNMEFQLGEYKPRTIIELLQKYTDYKIPDDVDIPEFPRRMFEFPKNYFKLPTRNNGSTDPDFSLRKIEPEDFIKLKTFGKQRGSTINDLILTALIRTLFKISNIPDGAELTLQVSNDIRSMFPKNINYIICNIFGVNFPPLCYHANETFEETLSMVTEKMNEAKKEAKDFDKRVRNELIMNKLFEKFMNSKEERPRPPHNFNKPDDYTHIILSNFTLIDENKLDFGNIKIKDAYEVGTISYGREFMLCASTYKNRMTLSTGYCHSNINKNDIYYIMDSIVKELYYCVNKYDNSLS